MERKTSQTVDLCDNIIRWSLIAAVALLPLMMSPVNYDAFDLPKATLLYALVMVILVSYLARTLMTGEITIKKTLINKPLLAFAATMTAATLASPVFLISIVGEYARYENLPTIYSYILLAFMAGQFMDKKEWVDRLVSISFISFGLISLYGILQNLGFDFIPQILRPQGFADRSRSTLGNPVLFGGYLAVMIPLLLNYLIDKEERLPMMPKSLVGVLLVVGLTGAILSQSRGAWIGVVAGIVAVIVLQRKQLLRGIGTAFAVSVFAVAFMLIVLSIAGQGVLVDRLSSIGDRVTTAVDFSSGSEISRVEIWKSSVAMISTRPLVGYGPDQMYIWSPAFNTLKKAQIEVNTVADRAHNIFLQVAINGGLLSLAAFLWLIIALVTAGSRLAKSDSPNKSYALGALAALTGYLGQSISGIDVIGIAAPVWVLAGTVAALAGGGTKTVLMPIKIERHSELVTGAYILTAVLIILSLKPLVADTYYLNGILYKAYGQSDLSTIELTKAVNMNPYQAQYRRDLAIALVGQGNKLNDASLVDKGISVLDAGLRLNPHEFDLLLTKAGAYRIYAAIANDQTMVGQSESYYALAINNNPYSTNPKRGLLGLYLIQEKYDEAIEQAEEIVRIDPSDNQVKFRLAQAYEKVGKYGRAKRIYKELLKINPNQAEVKAALSNIE